MLGNNKGNNRGINRSNNRGSKGVSVMGTHNVTTLVSSGTEVEGDVRFSGNLDVEGVVRGTVRAVSQECVARVVSGGRVEGEMYAPYIIINGEVTGDIHCGKHLELAGGARVHGNVHYALMEMATGAEIVGNITRVVEEDGVGEVRVREAQAPVGKAAVGDASVGKVPAAGASAGASAAGLQRPAPGLAQGKPGA